MKRIVIMVLMLAAVLTGAIPVWAANAEIAVQVCPSKPEVQVGDTVEYTVVATGSGVVAMQFEVRLPEGLRYVSGSGATPENLAQKLGVPAADWTEQSMMFTFYNDTGITLAKGTELLRFSCVAQQTGEWEVELYELLPFNEDFEEFPPKLQIQRLRVIDEETQVPTTVPEETFPVTMPAITDPEETLPSSESEFLETIPPATAFDSLEDPIPDEILDDPTQTGVSSNAQMQAEEENKTKVWLWFAVGAAVIAAGVVVFVIWKKKAV
jgi:uncharacterized repeat protein (TIGR01451 family)